jgi:hypothetical protein
MQDWQIVTENDVRAAVNALRHDYPSQIRDAMADEARLEEAKKTTLAILSANANEPSVAKAEQWARRQSEYTTAIKEYADAKGLVHFVRAKMKAAELTVECWRTQSSNERASR